MERRALVVDDEKFVAALVQDVLAGAGFTVRVAHTTGAASEALESFDPDVAILDISLGHGASGLDLAHLASQSYPGIALLLLTRYPDLRTAQIGPEDLPPYCGFLNKDAVGDSSVLIAAVESVLQEQKLRPPNVRANSGPLAVLTCTQLEVLRLVAQGYTSREVARRRGCTPGAVEKILGTIYQRLNISADSGIHPRVEAIRIYAAAAVMPERSD